MPRQATIFILLSLALLLQLCMNANGQDCSSSVGTCNGIDDGKLCNDRCKDCGYESGSCGGSDLQTCECNGEPIKMAEDVVLTRTRRGYGCPWNRYQCHSHCVGIRYRGGYCEGTLRQRCRCYG